MFGIQPVGVFTELEDSPTNKVYVVIPFDSADVIATIPSRLASDAEYQKAGAAYLDVPKSDPAYVRFQSSLLVAMDEKRGIGKDGNLPWRLSSDLKRFRELTMGHHQIVGRRTFESIGKPLPGRHTIVVTRNSNFKHEGCLVARSVEDAIAFARERGETEVFVIGGAEILAL